MGKKIIEKNSPNKPIEFDESRLMDLVLTPSNVSKPFIYTGDTTTSYLKNSMYIFTGDNYTYILASTVDAITSISVNIQFTCGDTQYTRITIANGQIEYMDSSSMITTVYWNGWTDDKYRTPTFPTLPSGALLTWLEANKIGASGGVLEKEIGSMIGTGEYQMRHYGNEKVSDLTGTTWLLNLDAESSTESPMAYTINLTVNNENLEMFFAPFYSSVGTMESIYSESGIKLYGKVGSTSYGYRDKINMVNIVDNAYRTITITGGSDVTNQTLINWFYANAKKQ